MDRDERCGEETLYTVVVSPQCLPVASTASSPALPACLPACLPDDHVASRLSQLHPRCDDAAASSCCNSQQYEMWGGGVEDRGEARSVAK